MFIKDDGIDLHIELERPEGVNGPVPLVVVIHGFTGDMEEVAIKGTAEVIRKEGYATLRAEMYGHGQSGGRFEDHTLYKWLNNAITVIDYARNLEDISDIYLLGHSQGGLTVVLAAAVKADVIKGLILLAPAVLIPEQARKGVLLGTSFDPDHVPDEIHMNEGFVLGGNYARIAQTINVNEYMDRYHGPVLVVHGEADEAVPVQYGIDTAKRYEDSELVVIPEETHCFDYHADQMFEAVRNWVAKRK